MDTMTAAPPADVETEGPTGVPDHLVQPLPLAWCAVDDAPGAYRGCLRDNDAHHALVHTARSAR